MVHLLFLEEIDAPVYNQIHQEQIVAGETTQNTFENPVLQEQVIAQEIPQAREVVDSSPIVGDVAAREYNQVLQPPVIFQEIPEVRVVASQTALNTSSTSTSSGVPAATHAATALAATDDFPIPPILDDEQACAHAQDEEGRS